MFLSISNKKHRHKIIGFVQRLIYFYSGNYGLTSFRSYILQDAELQIFLTSYTYTSSNDSEISLLSNYSIIFYLRWL